ncbi:MAG: glycerophosphodiester phosphodiesterase family protein [Pseudomonadota bacterium]
MKVIAHRGSNRKAPENSMKAFEIAIFEGASRIELDLQLSSDGVIFINHDDSLSHTTGSKGFISKMTAVELAGISLKNLESLPRLEQVLELLPQIELNLELKGTNLALVEALVARIADHPQLSKILVSSFEEEMMVHLKRILPSASRAFLWENSLPQMKFFDRIKRSMDKIETSIFHPDCSLIDEVFMDFVKHNGWTSYTWAPLKADIPKERWPVLKKLGVDGHCTNFPLEFKLWNEEQK